MLSDRSSDLLDNPAFMLSRMDKSNTVKTRHVKSFVCQLSRENTADRPVPESRDDAYSLALRNLACKNFTFVIEEFSNEFKMFDPTAEYEYGISFSDFTIDYLRYQLVALLVLHEPCNKSRVIPRAAIEALELSFDRDDSELDRA
jgi:hypothetical protein